MSFKPQFDTKIQMRSSSAPSSAEGRAEEVPEMENGLISEAQRFKYLKENHQRNIKPVS